jgi:hypothetical protein
MTGTMKRLTRTSVCLEFWTQSTAQILSFWTVSRILTTSGSTASRSRRRSNTVHAVNPVFIVFELINAGILQFAEGLINIFIIINYLIPPSAQDGNKQKIAVRIPLYNIMNPAISISFPFVSFAIIRLRCH